MGMNSGRLLCKKCLELSPEAQIPLPQLETVLHEKESSFVAEAKSKIL